MSSAAEATDREDERERELVLTMVARVAAGLGWPVFFAVVVFDRGWGLVPWALPSILLMTILGLWRGPLRLRAWALVIGYFVPAVGMLRALFRAGYRPDVVVGTSIGAVNGALVADGKFREDLFYRVNVIEIRVPPLRERLEDIDELVQSMIGRLGRQIGNRTLKVTEAALASLRDYHFPGNVRELENVLERAATLCSNGVIDTGDLQLRPKVANTEVPIPNTVAPGEKLGDALEDIERDAIVRALEQTRYNKTKAAQLLGMTFRSLRYRIKKLGIE